MFEHNVFPIEVGMRVYLQPKGNLAARHYSPQWGEIVKIARKYFYVDLGNRQEKFLREDFQNINDDCNSAWVIWPNDEDYNAWVNREEKLSKIKAYFRSIYDSRQARPGVIDEVYSIILRGDIEPS